MPERSHIYTSRDEARQHLLNVGEIAPDKIDLLLETAYRLGRQKEGVKDLVGRGEFSEGLLEETSDWLTNKGYWDKSIDDMIPERTSLGDGSGSFETFGGGSMSNGTASLTEGSAESLADQVRRIAEMTGQYLPQYQSLLARQSEKYLPRYMSLFDQLRDSDLANILTSSEKFRPRLDALQRETEGARLTEARDLGEQQMLEELRAGQSLSPAMTRNVEQGVRAGEVARGFGGGGGSANREAVQKAMEGFNLWKDRLGLSQQMRGFEQGMRYDPLKFTAGTPTNIPYAQGAFGQAVDLTSNALGGGMQMAGLQNQMAQFGANLNQRQQELAMDYDMRQRMYALESQRDVS